jgi:hypothetical protein
VTHAKVVILPFRCPDPTAVQAELVGLGVSSFVPEVAQIPEELPEPIADARRVALTALWLNAVAVPEPLVVVAYGADARLLPAFALAQRSAHRSVVGYVIVDGDAPAPATDWPDAPVWWALTDDAPADLVDKSLTARLRGFEVLEGTPVAAITAAL